MLPLEPVETAERGLPINGGPVKTPVCGRTLARPGSPLLSSMHQSYVDDPRVQGFSKLLWRYGQVQSYVRPIDAVHMTAGPDGVR